MAMRSALGRARGLGSAKNGVGHFYQTTITALGLVPLSLWFVISMIGLSHLDYAHVKGWMSSPGNASLMLLFVLMVIHHSQLGLQMVIEDYVHGEHVKFAAVAAVKLGAAFLAVFMAVSVLKVAIGV